MRVQPARTGRFAGSVSQYHAPAGTLSAAGKRASYRTTAAYSRRFRPHVRCTRSRPLALSARADIARLVDVDAHLLDEGVDGVEAQRAAQPDREVDRGVQAVEVQVGPVEGVGLHRANLAVERRVGADRDRGGPAVRLLAGLVEGGEPARVDAVGGDRGV